MLKKEVSIFELNYKIRQFLKEHPEGYSEIEKDFIVKNMEWGRNTCLVTDILRQIYDELNLLEENKNIYLGFMELIEKNFEKKDTIIEVGGGRLPRLGTRLALANPNSKIVVYEQELLQTSSSLPNLILKKERFTVNSNVNGASLICGFMPCEATVAQIQTACEQGINFITALCDGGNHQLLDTEEDYWEEHIIYEAKKLVKKHNLGDLKITYMKDYNNPYPVIYNQK